MQLQNIRTPMRAGCGLNSFGVWLVASLLANCAFAESVTLHPAADTTLFAPFPDDNLGASANFASGANGSGLPTRALMRFDLTDQIPSNAVIQSVALTVNVVIVPFGGGVSSVFDLRRVSTNWIEGTGTGNAGSPAITGEPTWNNRIHPYAPWAAPGGAIPGDFSGDASAAMSIQTEGSYTFLSTTGLVTDVQYWLLNPAANHGWALISEAETTALSVRRFGSREDTTNAPVLTVQYMLPATPDFQWIKTGNGQVQFSFLASAGQAYTVEYRDSLSAGNWLTLTNVAPQIAATNLIVTDPFPTNAQRFYRVGSF